jgi:hypothetical protein
MRFRKLRIAWSVGCGIACLLLIVLWVWSSTNHDFIFGPSYGNGQFYACSSVGRIDVGYGTGNPNFQLPGKWELNHSTTTCRSQLEWLFPKSQMLGFGMVSNEVRVPYWFLVLSSAGFATFPWLRWRFSLRTVLVATTLVAVVLGLILWLRQPAAASMIGAREQTTRTGALQIVALPRSYRVNEIMTL